MPKETEPAFPVGLILLAAGASVRMGTAKQLLRINGESLVRRAAQTALRSACQPVVVVLGANQAAVRPELADLPVRVVENPDWDRGMGSSISVGIRHLLACSPTARAAILMLADQPLVSADLLNQLIARHRTSELPLIACEYSHQVGVPALFEKTLFAELMELPGAEGAKPIIRKYAGHLGSLPFPDGALDVDTPADYQRLRERMAD
ncbi:MAG: nucleotidyltransferase family protein [Ferruginibacter sp.]|nr:nucleotidyltransferase family protein [Cytophagales bacterium]